MQCIKINSNQLFVVVNGDTYFEIKFPLFFEFHKNNGFDISIAITSNFSDNDYGMIDIDENYIITKFNEKILTNSKYINAGIYIFDKKIFKKLNDNTCLSLEKEIIPNFITNYKCGGWVSNNALFDIGTKTRYHKFIKKYPNHLINEYIFF